MYTFQPGDHLVTNIDPLGLTEHHGLYVGHGHVIHLSKQGIIEEIDLQQFAGGHKIRVKKSSLFPHQAIELARSQLGHSPYGVATNNCEHLAWIDFEIHVDSSWVPSSIYPEFDRKILNL